MDVSKCTTLLKNPIITLTKLIKQTSTKDGSIRAWWNTPLRWKRKADPVLQHVKSFHITEKTCLIGKCIRPSGTSVCPLRAAWCKAVRPPRSDTLTLLSSGMMTSAHRSALLAAATCSGVCQFLSRAFTSAEWWIKTCTASWGTMPTTRECVFWTIFVSWYTTHLQYHHRYYNIIIILLSIILVTYLWGILCLFSAKPERLNGVERQNEKMGRFGKRELNSQSVTTWLDYVLVGQGVVKWSAGNETVKQMKLAWL